MRVYCLIVFYTMVLISYKGSASPSTGITPNKVSFEPLNIEDGPDDPLLSEKSPRLEFGFLIGSLAGVIKETNSTQSSTFWGFQATFRETFEYHSFLNMKLGNNSYCLVEAGKSILWDQPQFWGNYGIYGIGWPLFSSEGLSTFGALKRLQFLIGGGWDRVLTEELDLEYQLGLGMLGPSFQLSILYRF